MTNSLPYRGSVLEGFYLTTKKVLGLVYIYYIVNLLDDCKSANDFTLWEVYNAVEFYLTKSGL